MPFNYVELALIIISSDKRLNKSIIAIHYKIILLLKSIQMHKFFFNLVFIIFLQHTSCLNAQGIEFNSSDFPINKRTSYNVFKYKQPKFSGEFNIDFKLSIKDSNKFGYIINVKDNKNPVSYSLVYVSIDKDYGEIKLNLMG